MHMLKDHKPKLSLWNIILDFNLKINKTTTITNSNKTSKLRECKQLKAQEKCFESNLPTLK